MKIKYNYKLTDNVLVVSDIDDAKFCNNGLNLGIFFGRFFGFSALKWSALCFLLELLFSGCIDSLLLILFALLSLLERSATTGFR